MLHCRTSCSTAVFRPALLSIARRQALKRYPRRNRLLWEAVLIFSLARSRALCLLRRTNSVADANLRLILVRHGVTAWNLEQRIQGHTDVELDPVGYIQAARIAERLSGVDCPIQAVYSSDLRRARLTAEAIAAPICLTVRTTPLLREMMLGDWEGLTYDEIIDRGDGELLARYRSDPYVNRPPRAEPMDEVWDRMRRAAELIRSEQSVGTVAVVGHGGSLKALLCMAMNAPITSMKHISLSNAGMSVIEEVGPPDRRVQRVVLMNDTSHLIEP
jgi:probable phosphoglycerate mutase